jgi:hypothetical protein
MTKLGVKPLDKINERIRTARNYLGVVGWTRGTQGKHGEPTDLVGALFHCDMRDGFEVVAARLLASRGFDTAWNDLRANNVFEVKQALEQQFDNAAVAGLYGERVWYAVVGVLRLLTMASEHHLHTLAAHIGPAHEPVIARYKERFYGNPAFEDAHLVVSRFGFDIRVWLMCDALIAHTLMFPDVDDELNAVVAPIAEKLGL